MKSTLTVQHTYCATHLLRNTLTVQHTYCATLNIILLHRVRVAPQYLATKYHSVAARGWNGKIFPSKGQIKFTLCKVKNENFYKGPTQRTCGSPRPCHSAWFEWFEMTRPRILNVCRSDQVEVQMWCLKIRAVFSIVRLELPVGWFQVVM